MLRATHKGKAHKKGQPNEDAYHFKVLEDGIFIGAVADGAGTDLAPFASVGSRKATEFAVSWLERTRYFWPEANNPDAETKWQEIIRQCFEETIKHLQDQADYLNSGWNPYQISIDAFATTLLIVVASNEWIVYGQIGDGTIIIQTEENDNTNLLDSELHQLTIDQIEFSNITTFITCENALDTIQIGFISKKISAICMLTDGLDRIAIDAKENMPRESFLNPLIQITCDSENEVADSKELTKYLASEKIQSKTFDDCCLLIAVSASEQTNEQKLATTKSSTKPV